MSFEGKSIVVTGAASGFGRAMAERFIAEGARVGIWDLNGDGAAQLADRLGERALAATCDVASAEQVGAATAAFRDAFGTPDIVINNAGWTNPNAPLMETDEATLRKLYEINVFSIFHMTKVMVPLWRETGGGVMINIGSTAGIRPRPGLTWYNSSKGAVNLLTRSLAVELAPDNIRVCAIAPVIGATALLESFMGAPDTPENRARFISTIPMGRLSEPEDVAGAAVYLASDDAKFITGVVLEVDGGRTV